MQATCFRQVGAIPSLNESPMSGLFTLFPPDAPPVSLEAPLGGIAVFESADPWALAGIWRAAVSHAALQRGDGDGDGSRRGETASAAELRVVAEGLSWLLPINPFEGVLSSESVGAFLGIEPLLLELAVRIGGWQCTGCGAMIFRDSLARIGDRLAAAEGGNVVCVVPRGDDSPPLRQLADFFEASRVLVNERVVPLTDCDDDEVLTRDGEGVVVASRSLPLTPSDAAAWMVEQCARHPCRLDVGIVGAGSPRWQRLGSIGSTARCMECGTASVPPTLRELRRGRGTGEMVSRVSLLDTPLDEVVERSLSAGGAFIQQIVSAGGVEGIDEAFLERLMAAESPLLRLPIRYPLKRLSPAEYVRLNLLRVWCAGVTGVEIVVDQLSGDDLSELISASECQTSVPRMGGMICLLRSEEGGETLVRERRPPLVLDRQEMGGKWSGDQLSDIPPGKITYIAISDEQARAPEQLVESVASTLRARGQRTAVVPCSSEEVFRRSGEVGAVSGLYRLLAELGARLPVRRLLGISEGEILAGLRGERELPEALFGVSSAELRVLPLELLVQRLPRVGDAHAVISWMIAAGGAKVTISEESRGHPPGLRVMYAISQELPLKKRCFVAICLKHFLSSPQQQIVETIFSEQIAGSGGGGRVVWCERG